MRKLFLENYNNVLTKTKSYFEIVEKIEFADAVVVWNDVLPEYRELLTKSALLGKPSLVMQHGLRATREYAVPYNKPLFSDRIMVWGPKDKQRLTNAGVEQERIIVTGSEIFDRFNNLEKLPHNGKNIVFAPMHWYEDLDENLMVASQLRRLCAEDNRFNIITKVVDSKNSEYYDNPVSSIAHEPNHLDVCASVLTRADLVVSVTESTFEFLAYMLDIPVIVVDVWKPKYHMDRLFIKNINADISKACLLVPIERLGEAIYRTLEEPKKLSPERKNALYDEAAIGWDNKSAVERIVDTVNSAIDNKEQFNAGTYLRSLSREISKKENQIQKYIARLHEDKGSVIQMEASHREKSKNKKVRAEINFLDFPICFLKPDRVSDSAWIEHVPFGMFLIDILRPRTLVELGTYTGVSYCSFCQTVKNLGIDTKCFAIDTWEGDEHGGFYDVAVYKDLVQYHDPLYGEFSRLIKSRFDEAALYFNDTSIDFLHIDGLHTYEAVKYDFETWFPKLSEKSIVLFHDTNVRERGFGVWRFYEELTQKYPHFEFLHGHGLGIVGIGEKLPEQVLGFFEVGTLKPAKVRTFFFTLGSKLSLDREKSLIQSKEQIIQNQLAERGQALEALRAELEASRGQAAGLQAQLAERGQALEGLRAELSASREQAAGLEAQLAEREQALEVLQAELEASREQAAGLEAELAGRGQALEGLRAELAEREQANTALTLQKAALQQELDAARAQSEQEKASLRAYQQEREQILQNLNSTLLEIYSSTAWKIIQWMWRVRLWLAPKGSRRERVLKRIFHVFLTLFRTTRRQNLISIVPAVPQNIITAATDQQGGNNSAGTQSGPSALLHDEGLERCIQYIAVQSARFGPISHMIILPFFGIGGAEYVALCYCRAILQVASGTSVLLVVADRGKTMGGYPIPEGVMLIYLEDFLTNFDYPSKQQLLEDLIAVIRPDTIHNINSEVAWHLIHERGDQLIEKTNLFASIFAMQFDKANRIIGYAASFLQKGLPYLTGLITDNHRFIEDAAREFGLSEEQKSKFHPVYIPSRALNEQIIRVAKERIENFSSRIRSKKFLQAVWAGRADAEKRIDLFFDVALRTDFVTFDMYGKVIVDGDGGLEIPDLPNLTYLGGFTDVNEIFASKEYDALIFTSRWEGMPNILIEAATWGVPIIAPDVGGIRELVNQDTGYLLPRYINASDYYKAFESIRNNPNEAARRAGNMLDLVLYRHNWDSFTASVRSLPGYFRMHEKVLIDMAVRG